MKPSNNQALNQALDSIGAIRQHLETLPLSETITYDAVCMRLLVIGETLKQVDSSIARLYPNFPLIQSVAVRNRIAHDYFGIDFSTLENTVRHDLDQLEIVIRHILSEQGTTWQFRSFTDLVDASY
jgi:uncharacterized protein with HEPN domain